MAVCGLYGICLSFLGCDVDVASFRPNKFIYFVLLFAKGGCVGPAEPVHSRSTISLGLGMCSRKACCIRSSSSSSSRTKHSLQQQSCCSKGGYARSCRGCSCSNGGCFCWLILRLEWVVCLSFPFPQFCLLPLLRLDVCSLTCMGNFVELVSILLFLAFELSTR